MTVIATAHACLRWRQRIDPAATPDQARAEILTHERAIASTWRTA